MNKFVLALDMDGVITRHPDHLRFLADRLLMSGHEVHIITGRMERERTETLKQLKHLHFRYTELHMFPDEYEYKGEALSVDDMQEIGQWKSWLCSDLGASLFMDDNQHYYRTEFDIPRVHI